MNSFEKRTDNLFLQVVKAILRNTSRNPWMVVNPDGVVLPEANKNVRFDADAAEIQWLGWSPCKGKVWRGALVGDNRTVKFGNQVACIINVNDNVEFIFNSVVCLMYAHDQVNQKVNAEQVASVTEFLEKLP